MGRPVRLIARHEDGHERWVEKAPGQYWIASLPGGHAGSGRFLAVRFDNVRMWARSHGYTLVSANLPRED